MSDDYFGYYKNTPFDLNNDGHIDPGEASYIQDTFYSENNTGSHSAYNKLHDDKEDHIKRIREEEEAKRKIKKQIVAIFFIIICFVFADSPGIILFVAAMLFSAKISRIW